jgi:hypothetical protein
MVQHSMMSVTESGRSARANPMVDNHGKRSDKSPAASQRGKSPGRLGVDDKGNVSWEWADDDALHADDTLGLVARFDALVDPTLKLAEEQTAGDTQQLQSNPKGLKKGYDPYDSGALGKQDWKKKKDLRELSKWIEMRKKLGQDTSEK